MFCKRKMETASRTSVGNKITTRFRTGEEALNYVNYQRLLGMLIPGAGAWLFSQGTESKWGAWLLCAAVLPVETCSLFTWFGVPVLCISPVVVVDLLLFLTEQGVEAQYL